MDIEAIKQRLAKPAMRFFAGGFRPTNSDEESWLGRVFLYGPDEGVPTNAAGEPLLPVAQFHLPSLPFSSPLLKDIRVLTLFVGYPFPDEFEPMGNNWLIREYRADDELVRKDLPVANSFLKAFPLRAEKLAEDYPLWDGGGVPDELVTEIVKLEQAGDIECYYEVITHAYEHKIGGYPSFCQSGVDPGDGFEFVFQVSSDAKINLNVIDSGSLMFFKHRDSGEWTIYYDFY
ncbi:DUF1963 domain-containing protein [Pseudomonas sp. BIGb0427]|uniref:DUF1963 domain-containing protein n=1 Tax=unclassified Pseudomonas TaxID=196821 RepID=UPI0018A6F1FB|nr:MULTISPECIES: DUF1963 domain-containing protein [unclassified Pseudomonas]QPG61408.1 DUF1963 domain-containing protein [Pseudomonas sp. BIGb0427]UVL58365.1 DUF1963 domain-containing protein [Pseudomonas sp. B21-035]UVM68925.1 DUF1963 domain-containing protein [Pseudomonas sp. B21-009]